MKRWVLLGILALSLLATSCGNRADNYNQPPEERRYYEGYRGMDMRFLDGDSPPHRLYYYSDTPDNTFDIGAELWNKGSSFARGGLYLSGYDPNLIQVLGINPDLSGFGTCGFSLGNIGFGSFGVGAFCDTASVQVGSSGTRIDVRDLGQVLTNVFGLSGWDQNSLLGGADFQLDTSGGNTNFRLSLGPGASFEYGSRGKLMVAIFSGVDFTKNFGIEYLLAGDTPEFPGGDLAIVDWDANILGFPPGLDETRQTFMITNCYHYVTHAAPVVCIDPSPFSEGRKVCRATQFKGTRGQGAPVSVTLVEQENTPRQAIFTIHVSNTGGGTVWDPGMIEKCSPYQPSRVTAADHNIVWLGQIRVSGDPARLQCTPDDYIRLDRDTRRGFITCRYDIPFQGLKSAYQTPLVIELWYGYEENIQRSVTIKRAI